MKDSESPSRTRDDDDAGLQPRWRFSHRRRVCVIVWVARSSYMLFFAEVMRRFSLGFPLINGAILFALL